MRARMVTDDGLIGHVNLFDKNSTKSKALKEAKRIYGKEYTIVKVVPHMGSTHIYDVYGHLKGMKSSGHIRGW